MKIDWLWKKFDEITGAEMHEILAARQEVFAVEQQCVYQDADDLDQKSWHCIGHDSGQVLVAYGRINFPGTRCEGPSLGRILTTRKTRGLGLGRQVVLCCLDKCKQEYPGMNIHISAQTYLTRFYKDFGFEAIGEPYDDEGIEHIEMVIV